MVVYMSEDVLQVRYRGPATVGSPGRAHLHDRDEGIGEFIWDALGRAGWLGETVGVKPTVELCIRVPPAPVPSSVTASRFPVRPGGQRRLGEPGTVSDEGVVIQRYEGPLHGRAVPGLRLVEPESRVEDFDVYEDMLYTAAVTAGWLSPEGAGQVNEVLAVDILVRIARRRA
jgi:hypothetical protein